MICPNCQMQQPQENLAYCVRCNYPLQVRPQGFFTKANNGYSRADVYSAIRRGQPLPQQQYQQITYPAQQVPQQNTNGMQIMYDAHGNQIYVQLVYDRTGKPVYVQMIPKIVGTDANGHRVYTMVSGGQVVVPQSQPASQQMPPQVQQMPQSKQMPLPQETAQFLPESNAAPPPVPVMPRPGEQPANPVPSVPDRPAVKASALASSMYAASQNTPGTGSFFARMQQQKNSGMESPVSAQELLKEEARTAFVPEPQDENAVLRRIFESKSKEYQMNTGNGNSTFAVDVPAEEVHSVSEKNLYKKPEKTVSRKPEKKSEFPSEQKEKKSEGLKLFRSKKEKEKPKHKTIIVDPDEIFGDSKKHKVEMLGISIDGDDKDVEAKIQEMKQGGKKSTRSMIDADVTIESMVDDPLAGDIARKALTDEVVQQAYDSVESAEIAKALEQLNQGIFPKSIK